MLPDPLHPAIVHFPIVFMFLLPVAAASALWAIRRGGSPRRAWAIPSGLALALTLSAWLAVETGESQEERVEDRVSDGALHPHEEAAERFLLLSGVLLLVSGAGLLGGRAGRSARLVTVVGAVGLAAAGTQVGHTGGKLVYQYGAASAYTQAEAGSGDAARRSQEGHDRRVAQGRGREADDDD
ncbi:MAG TPA: transglutaminaseTgpA domain-containing protein [Gemmatimonadales bacterium]|nr:transglutaminaseTgpA domain-containing protein [Gemmatimonadales bacterium]